MKLLCCLGGGFETLVPAATSTLAGDGGVTHSCMRKTRAWEDMCFVVVLMTGRMEENYCSMHMFHCACCLSFSYQHP